MYKIRLNKSHFKTIFRVPYILKYNKEKKNEDYTLPPTHNMI